MVSRRVIFKQEGCYMSCIGEARCVMWLPLGEVIDEGEDVVDNAVQKLLSLLGVGEIRMANRSGFGDLVELVYVINRAAVLHIGFAVDIGMFRTVAFAKLLFDAVRMEIKH